MNNVVSLRRVPKVAEPEQVSAVVVAGSGGAAATTTAFGLATALRLGTGKEVSAVDATSDGGNLLSRTGIGAVDAARSIRQFQAHMALTSAGVVVVGNGGGQPSDAAIVDELLAARHSARIHDVGTALRSPRLAPLLRSGAALVVVASARVEPLSRMRDALTWVMSTYGAEVLGRTIVVVSHQMPDAPWIWRRSARRSRLGSPGSSRCRSTRPWRSPVCSTTAGWRRPPSTLDRRPRRPRCAVEPARPVRFGGVEQRLA